MSHSRSCASTIGRRSFLALTARHAAAAAACAMWPAWARAQEPCAGLDRISEVWDTAARPMLASRYHRLQHCLFHYVRNNWSGLSQEQQSGLAKLAWATDRPSLGRAAWAQDKPYHSTFWATSNGSGEDFLYYHRWMIAMIDRALAARGVGPIEPWSGADAIPAPQGGCGDEQVPDFLPVFENPEDPKRPIEVTSLQIRVVQTKTPAFFWNRMNWWGQEFRDPGSLSNMTLGELGSRLEFGVHNQMHIRWSAYPSNGSRLVRDESDFRPKWDDPGYDTLFDEYSSHVTPIFFRLHKWIDNRIRDWAEAHGAEVMRSTTPHGFEWFGPGRWVQVAAPWTGRWGFDSVSTQEELARIRIMEDAMSILFPPPDRNSRFTAVEQEHHEREQRKVLSIRDVTG
jgi:hypothetical protein